MRNFLDGSSRSEFTQGFHSLPPFEMNGIQLDAIVLNDGKNLTTFQYETQNRVDQQIEALSKFGLSKSELKVIRGILTGLTNREVANQLFISARTLRTHLNNIYKKIPPELKNEILQAHSRMSSRPRS